MTDIMRVADTAYDVNSYEALKQRVHSLKKEHQKVVQTSKSAREVRFRWSPSRHWQLHALTRSCNQ